MDAATARALAEERRQELRHLLGELIAAPSPYGSSGKAAQDVVARYLGERGFEIARTTAVAEDSRDHVDYTAPPSAASEPAVNLRATPVGHPHSSIVLFAHIDTEPAGEGWTSDPLEGRERDGRIYGLGTADDKGGVAAALVAATILAGAGRGPVVLSVHGKGGGARGTLPSFASLRQDPRVALYLHPAETGRGLAELKHASRGVVDFDISVGGWQGPMREIRTPESAAFTDGGDALAGLLRAVDRLRNDLPDCEVNLGRVLAGERASVIPTHCRAEVRVLFSEPKTASLIGDTVSAALDASAGTGTGRRLTHSISEGLRANPATTVWEGAHCTALRDAVRRVTGTDPEPYRGHLASDIRFPIRVLGAPSVGLGSRAGNFYGPDEWVDFDDLIRLVAAVVLFGMESSD